MSQANAQIPEQEIIKVSRNDLPLSCPRPGDSLASMHPKVYLPIKKSGAMTCPYCGARYQLTD
ncbi:MAG: zinc-finger domain-containing protein [Pseudomonadota bacterium]